jgi:hypothetical protein
MLVEMQKVFFTVVGHVLHISPEKNNSKMQVKQKDDFLAALLQEDVVLLVHLPLLYCFFY